MGLPNPGDQVGEPDDGGHQRHDSGVPEPQPGGVLAIDERRPGHLGEGGHIRSGSGIGCLCVAQTLVGVIANRPQGSPVLGGDPPADAEVAGVADHRLGAQRPMLRRVAPDDCSSGAP